MDIKMASQVIGKSCRILTAMTVVITAQCENCGEISQVPIKSDGAIIKQSENRKT